MKKNKFLFAGIVLSIFLFNSCITELKNEGMTDEEYIKINVEYGYNCTKSGFDFEKCNEILDEVSEKYGYSQQACLNKKTEIHSDFLKTELIKEKIDILLAIANGSPPFAKQTNPLEDDDDWETFFIDNELYLKKDAFNY